MVKIEELEKIVNCLEWLLNNMVDNSTNHRILSYVGPSVLANKPIIEDALELLKAQIPRVMTKEEVMEAAKKGRCLFTECEKENMWIICGTARFSDLSIYSSDHSQDDCKITFTCQSDGETYLREWRIPFRRYNKTWRCWTLCPTDEQMEAVKWK